MYKGKELHSLGKSNFKQSQICKYSYCDTLRTIV